MDDVKRVLVTGAAGTIGQAVVRALKAGGHWVRGLDVKEAAGVHEMVIGTVADAEVTRRACSGIGTVIHLAATTDDADFMTELLPNNVVGVVNVLEGARLGGAKRVALASSMQTGDGFRAWSERVVKVEDGARPLNGYAATKVFAEAMGHVYFAKHGLEVICPRIGWLPRHVEMATRIRDVGERAWSIFLSHDDVGRFFRCAVEAERIRGAEPGYAVVYVMSRRKREAGPDLEAAKKAVGYEPADVFPQGLPAAWGIERVAWTD